MRVLFQQILCFRFPWTSQRCHPYLVWSCKGLATQNHIHLRSKGENRSKVTQARQIRKRPMQLGLAKLSKFLQRHREKFTIKWSHNFTGVDSHDPAWFINYFKNTYLGGITQRLPSTTKKNITYQCLTLLRYTFKVPLTPKYLQVHVYKELMQCKSVCDVKSGIAPLPFWLGREQKMLGFSQVFKPLKRQDMLEEGKNGRNAFRTGAKIHFSEKIFWG